MRLIKTLLILLLTGNMAIAQPVKGKTLLGGSVSLHRYNDFFFGYEAKRTDIFFTPSIGYFVGERIVIGTGIGLQYYNYKYDNLPNSRNKYIGINVNPHSIYFLSTGSAGIYLRNGIHFFYGIRKEIYYDFFQEQDITKKFKSSAIGIYCTPVLYYYFTPTIMATSSIGSIGYTRRVEKDEYDNKETTGRFYTEIHLRNISFGLIFIL